MGIWVGVKRFAVVHRLCGLLCIALVAADSTRGQDLKSAPPTKADQELYRFDPAKYLNTPKSTDGPLGSVRVVRGAECEGCPSGFRFQLEVKEGASGVTSQLTLQNETAQIDRLLLLSQSRTLIEGHVNGSVSIITVLDNSSGQVLGSLLCFVPSVSPDGTWLAYVKVYPLHFTDVSNEYYVANLNQRFVKGSIPPSHDNRIPIGQRIYPATADEGEHSWGSNKLFWVGAQNTLAFGDHWKGENQLVIADLRGHRAAPKVSVHRLESRLYVKESSCEEYRGRFGRAFFIGGVEPSGQGPSGVSVRLVFNDAACVLDEHISVDGVM